jgi:hypothetical protein
MPLVSASLISLILTAFVCVQQLGQLCEGHKYEHCACVFWVGLLRGPKAKEILAT